MAYRAAGFTALLLILSNTQGCSPSPPPAGKAVAGASQAVGPAMFCGFLRDAHLFRDTTVTFAARVPENTATGVPAHCRVVATIKPTPGSNIGVEYRLPDAWNQKFLGLGGGEFGGSIVSDYFAEGLRRGYSVAQTDTGHTAADGIAWALKAPGIPNADRVTDFAGRSVRLMTTVGKEIVNR